MAGEGMRPKDVLKEYIREESRFFPDHYDDYVIPALYSFVYWLEGQDRSSFDCRYHIVDSAETPCPFFGEGACD